MSASKKRKCEGDDETFIHIKIKADGLAEIELDGRFSIFPEPLLEVVKEQVFEYAETNETTKFSKIILLSPASSTYEVFERSFVTRGSSQTEPTKKSAHNSVGLANLAAMQKFMQVQFLSKDTDDEEWVELDIEPKLDNPIFDQQHSLRIGDLGWGFDKNGGISLCGASRTNLHVQHDSVYVVATKPESVDLS